MIVQQYLWGLPTMTFHPRMESEVEGLTVIGDVRLRFFNGAVADLWDVECHPGARGEYVSHAPRLVVVLDQSGTGGMDVTASRKNAISTERTANPLSYIPAGFRVWSSIEDISYLRHLDLHLDVAKLSTRLLDELKPGALDEPRLMFNDERVLSLARIIASECENPDSLHDLYGDSLICAIVVALMQVERHFSGSKGKLAPHHLRRAIEYIEDNCARSIRLEELAGLSGLSPAYFCHAFKMTTGVPPHRWQMRARVNRAKHMLENTNLTLSATAAAAGFSDQAHLTRVFRRFSGVTPQVWRKGRRD